MVLSSRLWQLSPQSHRSVHDRTRNFLAPTTSSFAAFTAATLPKSNQGFWSWRKGALLWLKTAILFDPWEVSRRRDYWAWHCWFFQNQCMVISSFCMMYQSTECRGSCLPSLPAFANSAHLSSFSVSDLLSVDLYKRQTYLSICLKTLSGTVSLHPNNQRRHPVCRYQQPEMLWNTI